MTVHCFTSISFSYLAKARVLASSVKRYHPDWWMVVCVTDLPPPGFNFRIEAEDFFDEVIWAHDLPIEAVQAWLFKHDVVEVCTAVKGPVLRSLLNRGAKKVFYLDPDIAVLAPLTPMVEWLDNDSILLTPHQLEPDDTVQAIKDNEIGSLIHGIYNLGFLAVNNDANGLAFADWWDERLRQFCYDDKARGLFVDQKWCDHVPAMFDGVKVVRDPGYNVASWNLSRRRISIPASGDILVNGKPLRFYHFTKLGPIGDAMTRRYAGDNVEVYEIWSWYKRAVDEFSEAQIPDGYWHYGHFSNQRPIHKQARVLYRSSPELQSTYQNPFEVTKSSFYTWLRKNHRKLAA
ncbi:MULTISPECIES: hypothetical protein [Rhodomicrobium]|uniref:hypothetical protein n=1 Tax=Rhodomicrobium TaxID=1068 RepID=UPI000B4A6819|nr:MULTISPECIES: hypothetical protein [Rhodomicrobium]